MGGTKRKSIRTYLAARRATKAAVGRAVASRRKRAMFTQAQFANILGVTERTVRNWETGRTRPSRRDLANIFPG